MPQNKDNHQTKAAQKNQAMRQFIIVARKIIDAEGLDGLSIRKIAQLSGYHNSTIYVHFKDLDQLIMLASMQYFDTYNQALSIQSNRQVSPLENFFTIWELFIDTLLDKPDICYNFFFGVNSDNLDKIISDYYQIFPEEQKEFSPTISSMYFGKSLLDRNTQLQRSLLNTKSHINEQNMFFLSELSISYCKYKLEQKLANPYLDTKQLKQELMAMLHYLFDNQ